MTPAEIDAALGPAHGPSGDWPLSRLSPAWAAALRDRLDLARLALLRAHLAAALAEGRRVYPPPPLIFAALDRTPPDEVRVVILGQDPYHGPGQAHGLSFSVQPGVPLPPSLRNIFRELGSDLGLHPPASGSLLRWADQGVLLLNAVLTVEEGQANSHAGRGWEGFTDAVIRVVNDTVPHAAFVLWGAYAQKKAAFVDAGRHLVLRSVHPSGLSARRGFFGSRPFSQVNAWLRAHGLGEIDWRTEAA
ncbi:uracil-DNA glycosylase [Roseomonas sp. NAR14]|uniref:Uracil-DNA glycosylase n=1 Tax=Roseomonas acroporae TaxID=2937791 RepID=A0A9X1YBM5_9PROT|nr:uracil-DNA glycosylase [Roseomonas acroporae]MCK8787804.1 uracil-DNA glycosylase [Roseomonas acroporae]